jgi:hypothetical protein
MHEKAMSAESSSGFRNFVRNSSALLHTLDYFGRGSLPFTTLPPRVADEDAGLFLAGCAPAKEVLLTDLLDGITGFYI